MADKLAQVRKLLDKAAHPNTPDTERDTCLKLADRLMAEHGIEMAQVDALKPREERRRVEHRTGIVLCEADNPWRSALSDVHWDLVLHLRVRAVYSGLNYEFLAPTAAVIGMADDLDYLEQLYTSIFLHLASRLEPKPSRDLTHIENLVVLKEAGLTWERAYALLQEIGQEPAYQPWKRNTGVRYTRLYADYCKATGREQVRANPRNYQVNFVRGYVSELRTRLYEMSAERRRLEREPGTALVLSDLRGEIEQAFQEAYPVVGVATQKGLTGKANDAAREAGRAAAREADLSPRRAAAQAAGRKQIGR